MNPIPELAAGTVKVSLLEKMRVSPARVIAPIECDEMAFEPPVGLAIAGFVWRARPAEGAGGGWEIDENLVDTVVGWSALGNAAKTEGESIECVVEIDYREEVPAEDLVHLASSGEFSLALVGLEAGAPAEKAQAYADRLSQLARAMLKASNFSKRLYPFSLEFEAVFLESMGKTEDAERARGNWARGLCDARQPSGARVEYALRRTGLGRAEVSEACKAALLDHFGGRELLDAAMSALARPIARRVERFADEIKAQPKAKQDRFGLTPAD